jgi:hypothetical protein
MSVCCECCVLSGRGLCDEIITHPEESYRLWSVVVFDIETSSYTLYRYWIGVSGQIDALLTQRFAKGSILTPWHKGI